MIVVSRHYRRCTHCGEFKPLHPKHFERRKSGRWCSWCRACRVADARARYHRNRQDPEYVERYRAQSNAARRRRRQLNPEVERARTRREYAQQMTRPGVRERSAARHRRNYHIRQGHHSLLARMEFAGEPPWEPVKPGSQLVDAGPISVWMRVAFHGWAAKEIGRWLGEDETAIARLLCGERKRLSLHIADRMLTRAGRPDLLNAFYPVEDAA